LDLQGVSFSPSHFHTLQHALVNSRKGRKKIKRHL